MSDQDYDYITLYLPYMGATARYDHSSMISDECKAWLETNVGPGTTSGQAWMLAHDTDDYQWCYMGFEHSPESHHTEVTRCFMIRDPKKALMFKLVWGG